MPARKPTFSDRFYRVLEKLFREIDQGAIEAEVKALRQIKPRASKRELAAYLTRKAAAKTAAVGAAAASVPGPAALLAMGPDIFNLVRQQSRLVLSIAFLYGQKPNLRERFREVLATLAIASGASATKKATQYVVMHKLRESAGRQLARRVAGRYVSRRASTVVAPVIGFLVGGTINYLSVRAVGIAAQKYYSARVRRKPRKAKKRRVSAAARSSRPSSRTTRARAR